MTNLAVWTIEVRPLTKSARLLQRWPDIDAIDLYFSLLSVGEQILSFSLGVDLIYQVLANFCSKRVKTNSLSCWQ